ncbi:MAG: hypothetical protein JSW43_03920 [Gemmatimonadota bacterium]|nr:MAG: hypothetical protein JSW43_03920 [Gemmatimonadota bacterium]
MSGRVTVFVNERPVEVDAGSTVLAAVRAFDARLAEALNGGGAYVTDGVGRRIDPASPLSGGSIVRVVGAPGAA